MSLYLSMQIRGCCYQSLTYAAVAAGALSLGGCGGTSGPARTVISGKATHSGQPIPFGEILFLPDETKGGHGPAGLAVIEDGTYRSQPGRGPVPGAQIALVTGYASKEVDGPNGRPVLFTEVSVPLDVAGRSMEFDLEIPGKAAR